MNRTKQEERGYELLENSLIYPGLPSKKMSFIKLRLWIYPSFEPFVSWSIIQSKKEYFARRIVWNQRKVVLTDEPQTYGAEVKIEKSVLEELESTLAKIEIKPFIPVNTIGIDGVTQGVEVGGYMLSSKISWWGDAPDNWQPLEKWLNKYIANVNGLFPEASLEIPTALTRCSS